MNELEDKLKATILAAEMTGTAEIKRKAPAVGRWAVPAFALAAAAAVLLISRSPKDTFDSPELAYAELERTFAYISQKIDTGAGIAASCEARLETIKNIFE